MKNYLHVLRAERNWSQAELAKQVHVSRQTINAIETGRSDPSLPLALAIAQAFGKLIEEIFVPDRTPENFSAVAFRRLFESRDPSRGTHRPPGKST
jgi:putative transcriptional regulator